MARTTTNYCNAFIAASQIIKVSTPMIAINWQSLGGAKTIIFGV
jgi:hypothetical protein